MAITAFTRPHEAVYQDVNGVRFLLSPGSPIYEEIYLQYYNDEEADEAFKYSEILQLTFGAMTVEQIEKEYCRGHPLLLLKKLEDVAKSRYPEGIPNVFDREYKDNCEKTLDGEGALVRFGVSPTAAASAAKELIGKL